MYREPIGDNLARTILGVRYSSECNYFMIFKQSVTQVEQVCKQSGASEIVTVEESEPSVEKLNPPPCPSAEKPSVLLKIVDFIFILLCAGAMTWVYLKGGKL